MQYLLYFLAIPFLFINYKIIISDLKEKKIPNNYLLYLLILVPFFYFYLFSVDINVNLILYSSQIIITFLVSFILYYFGIWAAGDAKYLLILSLFIPHIGIIPIVGNLSLITIIYLLIYFIYFYLIKLPLNKQYSKSLFENIIFETKEKWKNYKNKKGGDSIKIISKYLLIFLTIFVSIRLTRIYIFNSILKKSDGNMGSLQIFMEKYNFYLVFLLIGLFLLFLLFTKRLYIYISKKLNEKLNLEMETISNIFLYGLLIFLIGFISYEFGSNPKEISYSLYRIFTLYILLHLIIKVLIYSYKITFGIAENQYINLKELKKGDIVDKTYLIKLFGEQDCLLEKKDELYDGSPINYFINFKNPVDEEELKIIKKSFDLVNKFHNKNTMGHQNIEQIKVLKTFAFGPYIFSGFLITVFFGNSILLFITNHILDIIKKVFF